MRVSLPLLLTIAAAAVDAAPAPIAEADAKPWCQARGEPCWKSKRSADAFMEETAARIHEARDAEPWCQARGEPCWKSKREAEAFLDASGLAARFLYVDPNDPSTIGWYIPPRPSHTPTSKPTKRDAKPDPWCEARGEPCWKDKRAAKALIAAVESGHFVPARDAEPEPEPWCQARGEPCWKSKRSAEAFIEETAAHIHEARNAEPWCQARGEPCWKSKREAEAFLADAGLTAGGIVARDAEPWCEARGEPCWKNKRAAEALIKAVEAGHFVVRDPQFYPPPSHRWPGYYYHPSHSPPPPTPDTSTPTDANEETAETDTTSVKARDAAPEPEPWCEARGEPCWKSKRSAMAFVEATRANINEARDAAAEPWCQARGEPCWKNKRAAEAFLVAADAGLDARNAEPWCEERGEPCWKNKREAEAFIDAIKAGSFVMV